MRCQHSPVWENERWICDLCGTLAFFESPDEPKKSERDRVIDGLPWCVMGALNEMLVREAEDLQARADMVRGMRSGEYLARGIELRDAEACEPRKGSPDPRVFIAGPMRALGWRSIEWDADKPGWHIHGGDAPMPWSGYRSADRVLAGFWRHLPDVEPYKK